MDNRRFETIMPILPKSSASKARKNILTLKYNDAILGLIKINLILDDTFIGTDGVLLHDSLLKGAYFMIKSNLSSAVFFGGSLIRNLLDIPEKKIDDYDIGYFDENKERGESIVTQILESMEVSGEWRIVKRDSDKITLPLAQEEVNYFLESGASAFLQPISGDFTDSLFEFGHEDKLESTLSTENISANLSLASIEQTSDCNIYTINCGLRGKEFQKTLNELSNKQAIINRNITDFVAKYDILQRFLVTTIKYGVSLTEGENPESALFILRNFGDRDFYSAQKNEYKKILNREDIIILEKRKEFCLNKFFNLLTRISPMKREVYFHNLVESKILEPFIPEVHEMLSNNEVRRQLLVRGDINGALPLYNFISEIHIKTKEVNLINLKK